MSHHYRMDSGVTDAIAGVMKDFDGDIQLSAQSDEELSDAELRELSDDAPIIRLANLIITQAITDKASDIHMEPCKDGMRIRYRIDGVLLDGMKLPRKVVAPLTSRVKIMSDMDIAEKRSPQDSRISATIGGKDYDFRVSTLPMVYGEKIVMRARQERREGRSVEARLPRPQPEDPGGHVLQELRHHPRHRPHRLGKSTTLYSVLNKINDGSKKHHYHRRPGRVRAGRHQPVRREREGGDDLLRRPPP